MRRVFKITVIPVKCAMLEKIKIFLEMIKIEHTVFAMPFLYSGAILAADGIPSSHVLLWITVGIISARTAAMCLNRLIDMEIDSKNPRTRMRALPAGLISPGEVGIVIWVSLVVLLLSALKLNPLCVILYPLAVSIFIIYPYLKRFTWLSHIVLGTALGMAPVGAWVAVTGSLDLAPVLLGIAVTFWVAGFDVIYAYRDLEFDREFNLYSIPRRFGEERGIYISSFFHVLTVVFLILLLPVTQLGWIFLIGVVVISALLFYEHSILAPGNMERLQVAFFNVNIAVGISFFVFITADVLVRNM